ncbi:MAG: hydrogenase maturation protease [Bacteroidota bacterium]|nr:hydrogenase maturation protease [Bacteroidota bacterium]
MSIKPTQEEPPNNRKRVMIAGVGNMFMKDDGFGGAVIKKILNKEFPEGVEVKDFGTGGLKLAYDLMKGYDGLILLDASQRGEKPGTLYVIEPEEGSIESNLEDGGPIDPHGSDPATILRFVKGIGAWPAKVLIVACEPSTVEDFEIGLTDPVNEAVDRAVEIIDDLLKDIYSEAK